MSRGTGQSVLDRARGVAITRAGISDLARLEAAELDEGLRLALDQRDVRAASALALGVAARGGTLASDVVARLVPDIDQRELVPSLLRACSGSDAERLAVMQQALERGQLSHDREAVVAFVASRLLGKPPWPVVWVGLFRTLARQRLGSEAGILLGILIQRSEDAALREIGEYAVDLAQRSNGDEVASFWLEGWEKPVLEVLPETEPPRVIAGYTVRKAVARPGRNDACHCGSGKKYKKCCAAKDDAADRAGEAPVTDVARLTAIDVEGMRIQETIALPFAELPRPALRAVVLQLRAYHRWEDAERALAALAAKGPGDDVQELRGHLIEESLRMRALDVLDRQLAQVEDPAAMQSRVRAGIACARPGAGTLVVLDEQARTGLGGDRDALADVAFSLLDHAPALGILVARGTLDPEHTADGDVLLEEVELARDRLGLPPQDPYGPLYDAWVEENAEEREQATAASADLERLRAELARAEGERDERRAEVVALEHEVRDLRERAEKQVHRETAHRETAVDPSEQAARAQDERVLRLTRKVEEMKALLAEGNAERARLRERVAELETRSAEVPTAGDEVEESAAEGTAEEGAVVGEETLPVRIPIFTRKATDAIAGMPGKVARAAVSIAGRLAAGDRAAWRDVKRMQGMESVWTARLGIHHRLIFTITGTELSALDVVTREALLTTLERFR